MNKKFSIKSSFRVPDGTVLSPFLNAKDSESDLPFSLLDDFSIAAGTIERNSRSKIHNMSYVIQVTFVRSGILTIKMKSQQDITPYTITVLSGEAVLAEANTFIQLINDTSDPVEVLYVVSPPYVFDAIAKKPVYDDSTIIEDDWQDLELANWDVTKSLPTVQDRADALKRIKRRKEKLNR